jgi:DNA-directed RNA polymerase specialized sigma24 family protein
VENKLSKLGDEAAEKPERVTVCFDPQLDIAPSEQFSEREAARRQVNALKEKAKLAGFGLTDREDEVLELHEIQGYTHAEIAMRLKLSEGTSQAALKMGMKKLRRAAS